MADTRDLKSLAKYLACGFESRLRHQCVNRRRAFNVVGYNAKAAVETGNRYVTMCFVRLDGTATDRQKSPR